MERPRRAFEVYLHVTGDDWSEVSRELMYLSEHVAEHGAKCDSTRGGVNGAHAVYVRTNPEMTNRRYFEELECYLALPPGERTSDAGRYGDALARTPLPLERIVQHASRTPVVAIKTDAGKFDVLEAGKVEEVTVNVEVSASSGSPDVREFARKMATSGVDLSPPAPSFAGGWQARLGDRVIAIFVDLPTATVMTRGMDASGLVVEPIPPRRG